MHKIEIPWGGGWGGVQKSSFCGYFLELDIISFTEPREL